MTSLSDPRSVDSVFVRPASEERLPLVLVFERYLLTREYNSIIEALDYRFELRRVVVESQWPADISEIPEAVGSVGCLWFVRFRNLIARPPFRWGKYHGLRMMYDQDAYQTFNAMAGTKYLGRWPAEFHRHAFQVLFCTGKATRDHLLENGVRAVWVPKAFDHNKVRPLDHARDGICFFGSRYAARAAMLDHLKRARIPFTPIHVPHTALNAALNEYLACLICNMEGTPGRGIRRPLSRLWPARFVNIRPAPELMMKNFEVSGAGCAPICDALPELDELGFRDGDNVVTYSSFEELIEKVQSYLSTPERLMEIGKRSAATALAHHTWFHRAAQIDAFIRRAI